MGGLKLSDPNEHVGSGLKDSDRKGFGGVNLSGPKRLLGSGLKDPDPKGFWSESSRTEMFIRAGFEQFRAQGVWARTFQTQNAYASTYCTSLNCKDADITRKTMHQLAVAL